jgi:hypothetical protein
MKMKHLFTKSLSGLGGADIIIGQLGCLGAMEVAIMEVVIMEDDGGLAEDGMEDIVGMEAQLDPLLELVGEQM